MKSFLEKVFEYTEEKAHAEWSSTLFLFPNNRSAYYFKELLKEKLQPGTILPKLETLEHFIFSLSDFDRINQIIAVAKLYDVYKQRYADTTLQQFLSVGKQMIADFDELNRELVDTKMFFKDLQALKSMNVYMEDDEEKVFKYKYFWETFELCYNELNQFCDTNRQAYDGKIYQDVAAKIASFDFNYTHIYFVGFTQLSKSETAIVKFLLSTSAGEYLMDIDKYYFDASDNIAAIPYKKAIKSLGIRNPTFIENNIEAAEKEIFIYPCNGKTQQVQAAFEVLEKQHIAYDNQHHTAMVLPDANIVNRLLDHLPEQFAKANISMGLPVKDALIVRFLRKLHEALKVSREFNGEIHLHKSMLTQLAKFDFIFDGSTILTRLNGLKNLVYINVNQFEKYFPNNGLLVGLLQSNADLNLFHDKISAFIHNLLQIEKDVIGRNTLIEIKNSIAELDKSILVLNSITGADYLEFLFEMISGMTIPYDLDPTKGLQIMGIMESRNLDYEQVFLFSMNEGTFPKTGKGNSYIPHELRMVYLSSPIEKDAISTYLFYRLLHRSSVIHLLYDTNQDSFAGGEPSRFILQTKIQLAKLPNIKVTEYSLKSDISIADKDELNQIEKTADMKQKIAIHLSKNGLSPSAINVYNNCSIQFYYKYILAIKPDDEAEEGIDAALIGSAVHHVLETLFTPFVGKSLTEKDVLLMQNKTAIEEMIKGFLSDRFDIKLLTGKNYLFFKVCNKLANMFLRNQLDEIKQYGSIKILALEEKLEYFKDFSGVTVKFKGLADRIDTVSGKVRIIDYKTGNADGLSIKEISSEILANPRAGKKMQLLMYAWMYQNTHQIHDRLCSGIYWLRKSEAPYENLSIAKVDEISKLHLEDFENVLSEIIGEMLNENVPFEMTEDQSKCKFCDFKDVCNRN